MIFIQWLLIHSLAHAAELTKSGSSEEVHKNRSPTPRPRPFLEAALAHHVLVVYTRTFCSGSIIHSKVVLTVASCFYDKSKKYDIMVKYAVPNYLDQGPSSKVIDKKEHEFFQNKSDLDNDIALLILEKHIEFKYGEKKSILFEPGTVVMPEHSYILVTGWGKDVTKSQENTIQQSNMQVIDQEECHKTFLSVVTPSLFCAKYDVVNRLSDNGGAAFYKGLVVGISSYGANLEDPPHVALFTNVSYFYKWIKLNTEILLLKHCSQELKDELHDLSDY